MARRAKGLDKKCKFWHSISVMNAQTKSFRDLLITILSDDEGVAPGTYVALVEYVKNNHPDSCDDIFSATGQIYDGFVRYHLRYDHAAKLKEVQ